MHGEDRRGDQPGGRRQQPAQRVPEQQDRQQVQSQVDGVIASRVSIPQPVVDPERQIRERPDFEWTPQLSVQQRVIVKMERAPQASAKCDDSGEA